MNFNKFTFLWLLVLLLPGLAKPQDPLEDLQIGLKFPDLQCMNWRIEISRLTKSDAGSASDIPYYPTFDFTGADILGLGMRLDYKKFWIRAHGHSSLFSEIFHLGYTATLQDSVGNPVYAWDYRDAHNPVKTDKVFRVGADRTEFNVMIGVEISDRNSAYLYFTRSAFQLKNKPVTDIVPGSAQVPGWEMNPFRMEYKALGLGYSLYSFLSSASGLGYKFGFQVSPFSTWDVQSSNRQSLFTTRSYEVQMSAGLNWHPLFLTYHYYIRNSYHASSVMNQGHSLSLGIAFRIF